MNNIFDIFDELELKFEKKSKDKITKSDISNISEISNISDISDEDKSNICKHNNTINEQGTFLCKDCGVEISKVMSYEKDWRYYGSDDTRKNSDPNRCHIRKVEDKSIFKDVENFGFSDKIVNTANDIYAQVTKGKIYRGNSRKAIIFGCVFHSIKLNGKSYTCESLGEIFKLDRKIILKGLKHVSLNAPKSSDIKNKNGTNELLDEYIVKFEIKERDEIVDIYNKIRNKSTIINRSRPQSVISSLIYYFLCKKYGSNNVNIKDFIKKVKLSELTIIKISKEIEEKMKE
jgi:transcription initiation factor TFIIIB Brf1 subunit/transcription initiation factor TFIIB